MGQDSIDLETLGLAIFHTQPHRQNFLGFTFLLIIKWFLKRTVSLLKKRLNPSFQYNDTLYLLIRSYMIQLHSKNSTQKLNDIFSCYKPDKKKYHLQPCLTCALNDFWICLQPFSTGITNPLLGLTLEYNMLFKSLCTWRRIQPIKIITQQCGSGNFPLWRYLKKHNLKIPVQQIQSYSNELVQYSPRCIIDQNLHGFLTFLNTEIFHLFFYIVIINQKI